MGESPLFSVNLSFLLVKLSTLHFFFLDTEGFQKVNEVTTHTSKNVTIFFKAQWQLSMRKKSASNIIKLIKIMSEDKLIRTPVYRDMSLCHCRKRKK